MKQVRGGPAAVMRRVLQPFWIMLVVSLLAIAGFAIVLMQVQDRNARVTAETLVRSVVSDRLEDLAALTVEYGYWDAAVENMVETQNLRWIEDNLGPYIYESRRIKRLYVVGPDGVTVYAAVDGETVRADMREDLSDGAAAMVADAMQTPGDAEPVPVFGFVLSEGVPYLASAVRMTTYTREADIGTDHVLVFTRAIDDAYLAALSGSYLLNSLKHTESPASAGDAAVTLTTYDGTPAGVLTWKPALPGTEMIPKIGAAVALAFLVMAVMSVYFMRRATEVARALNDARVEADRASAAKSEFLRNAAHELRTPVNAILGFSDVMKQELFGPIANEKYREYTYDIHNAGKHMNDLVRDLLDLARIEAGELSFEFQPVNVPALLSEATHYVGPQAAQKGVEIVFPTAPEVPEIRSDAKAIRQIAVNLIANAVKFTPAGGTVTCRIRAIDPRTLAIEIEDTGIGIADSDIPRVLEPFGQVRSEAEGTSSGTGLGLPITKRIAEALGGGLSLASKVGVGTTVTVTVRDP